MLAVRTLIIAALLPCLAAYADDVDRAGRLLDQAQVKLDKAQTALQGAGRQDVVDLLTVAQTDLTAAQAALGSPVTPVDPPDPADPPQPENARYVLHKPLVITQDNYVVPGGKYVVANDYQPWDASPVQIVGDPADNDKVWGVVCEGVEIAGHPQLQAPGLYINGAARLDLDVRVLDCPAGGISVHGWNVRGRVHCMNNGMYEGGDAIALHVHNDWADQVSDREQSPKEWHREATNIVRFQFSHLERSTRLIYVDDGTNDFQYEGILHGPTEGDRTKLKLPRPPLVEFAGVSGVCRLAGQLVWSDPAAPSVRVTDLGQGTLPRPVNFRVELQCSDWNPYVQVVSASAWHPLTTFGGFVQKYGNRTELVQTVPVVVTSGR